MDGASFEGRFWLGLTLLLGLTAIFAFSTENEALFLDELYFTLGSVEKGVEFLTGQTAQKWPGVQKWIPKRRIRDYFIKTPPNVDFFQERSDPASLSILLSSEFRMVNSLLQRKVWRMDRKELVPTTTTKKSPFSDILSGVKGYAESAEVFSFNSSWNSASKSFIHSEVEARKLMLKAYKNAIIKWFDRHFDRQLAIITKTAGKAFTDIAYLQGLVMDNKNLDMRLKRAIERKINTLETFLGFWMGKLQSDYSLHKLHSMKTSPPASAKPPRKQRKH